METKKNLLLLIAISFSFAIDARAQINENGVLPEEFKALPSAAKCEAWKIGTFDNPDTLAGKVELSLKIENEPFVTAKSDIADLNISFGRRLSLGDDHTKDDNYCAYFYDKSSMSLTIKYFCSDINERSWMNNTFSSISFGAQRANPLLICKEASRGGGPMNARYCWRLKNCK